MSAHVIVLAGPSGVGKTRLTRHLGLPVLRLDDFYKDGDDPSLPCIELPGGPPIVDWDDPGSWDREAAVAAIATLCASGSAELPVYDLSTSRRVSTTGLDIGASPLYIAEGIFAHHIVAACEAQGLLAGALCLNQPAPLVFVRRLARDLAEHRKPPWVLVRRGLLLWGGQRRLVAEARAHGCEVVGPPAAERIVRALLDATQRSSR